MKNKILIISSILVVLLLTIFINFSGFIWLILLTFSLIISLLFLIWKRVKRKSITLLLKVQGFCMGVLCLGIVMGLLLPYKQALPDEGLTISEQIQYIYNSDQSDRKTLKSYVVSSNKALVNKRDQERLNKVRMIYENVMDKKIDLTNQDKFNLAMIFHHGQHLEDYTIAHALAKEVAESDSSIQNVQWLAKATYDRLLLAQGKPQKYGTQH